MESPETMFDEQLAAAGAAVEVCANMSAFANHLLYQAEAAATDAGIQRDDARVQGIRELLTSWEELISPGFARATQKDPTGPRGLAVQRPWRDPKLVAATA